MRLSAEGVDRVRGGRAVLSEVSLTAEPGRKLGLIGPNGSGKSSLLRVLAGIDRPERGTVRIGDQDLHRMSPRDRARRLAVVDQHAETDVDITAEDIVRLGRIPHRSVFGSDPSADAAAIDRALGGTGARDLRTRRWHTLSGGERQRVQIARALAQQPTHLLLDEPTNHLDVAHQLEILELVTALELTTVVALHDLNLAAMYCDHIVVLQDGRVVADGTPAEVLTAELIGAVYRVPATVTEDAGVPAIRFHRPLHRA